jgi:dephospho-CoA kinase
MGATGRLRARPYLIGLTGNIATGKSEVARTLGELGAMVIDADQVAHEVMRPEGDAYGAVLAAFGNEILDAEGQVDRRKLGAIVFRDPEALRRLEQAVHPAVLAEVERRIVQAAEPVVVVEAIKLIEAGMQRGYDSLWVVTAPRDRQIARLVASRGWTEEEAALRVDAQPPQELKVALADVVLANETGLEELQAQVRAAFPGPRQEVANMALKEFMNRHPRLTAWAALAVGMVVILVIAARNVGFLAGQWAALIVATILLAGLCVWIIGWNGADSPEGEGR